MRHAKIRFAAFALLMSAVLFYRCPVAPQSFGEWESTIALEPATGTWSMETDFTLGYALADWTVESRTLTENDEWKNQDFELVGSIGAIDIESDLRFEPSKHRFRDWITEFEWGTEQLTLTLTTKLTRTTDWLILELEREREGIEMDARFRFRAPTGACGLLFYDASVGLAFEWCGIDTDLEVAFDDDGFDELVLELKEIAHPRVPWATFDLEITRALTTTIVELTPELALTTPWCEARLDLEFDGTLSSAPSLLPLTIDKATLSWEIGDWETETTAYADPVDWIDGLYWLEMQAENEVDLGVCGELSFELEFLWTESAVGEMSGALGYGPGNALTVGLAFRIDCRARHVDSLECGLSVAW